MITRRPGAPGNGAGTDPSTLANLLLLLPVLVGGPRGHRLEVLATGRTRVERVRISRVPGAPAADGRPGSRPGRPSAS